jgi:hypothetical protein
MSGMINIFTEALNNENEFTKKFNTTDDDVDLQTAKDTYFTKVVDFIKQFIELKTSYYDNNQNYFKELCTKGYENFVFSRFAFNYLLKSLDPRDITKKTELNNFLFSDNPDENCIKNHILTFNFIAWKFRIFCL